MSINPVTMLGPISDAQLPDRGIRREQTVNSAAITSPGQSISRTEPKREVHSPKENSSRAELPEDVVQVQRDGEANGVIVIKYMDHSGNVILQVPSSQMLGIMRSIGEDFQRAAEARTNAMEAQKGQEREKPHGD